MANVLQLNDLTPHATTAIVQGGFGKEFMVHSSEGVFRATLTFSCLIRPEKGDTVLLNNTNKQYYIVAIIERPSSENVTLSFAGDVAIEAKSGAIKLASREEVSVTSAKEIHLTSTELAVNNLKMNVQSQELSIKGDKATSQWREINSISDAFNSVVKQLTQRIKNSFKMVEGVDQQTSKNYMQTVEKTMSIRSRDAVITARKDIKIDGERIHMG